MTFKIASVRNIRKRKKKCYADKDNKILKSEAHNLLIINKLFYININKYASIIINTLTIKLKAHVLKTFLFFLLI